MSVIREFLAGVSSEYLERELKLYQGNLDAGRYNHQPNLIKYVREHVAELQKELDRRTRNV
jgi:hypothetical protein